MNPFGELLGLVHEAVAALQADGGLPAELELERVAVDPPRDAAHGEAATNAALVLAKAARKPPMALAGELAAALEGKGEIAQVSIAAPGFINLTMRPAFWQRQVRAVLAAGPDYGRSEIGAGRSVNVEFCSANPTGPLHVGHGRGTVFGDALAAVLGHAGFAVTREYYLNDGGAQTETLARSLHLRYREALGEAIEIPVRPLSRRLPEAGCGRDRGQGRRPVAGRWRVRVAGTVHQHGHRRDAGADPRRSRGAGCGTRCVHLRAPADRRRPDRRGPRRARRHGPALHRHAAASQGRQARRRLGAGAAAAVPLDRVWRRDRPSAQALERCLDLLRCRHRLSSRQVPPRLSRHGRRLGRRSCGLHQADAGRGPCASPRARAPSTCASASWSTCSTPARR